MPGRRLVFGPFVLNAEAGTLLRGGEPVPVGAPGEIVFEGNDHDVPVVYRIKEDGSGLQKILSTPMLIAFGVSPDGRWVPAQDSRVWGALMAFPSGSGAPVVVCTGCSPPRGTEPMPSPLTWTPDGKFVYLTFATSTYAIPLLPGQMLPAIPAGGFPSKAAVAALPGAQLISDETVYPGPNPSVYAVAKMSAQRNIYRVPVP
jgi:hypothetical protein